VSTGPPSATPGPPVPAGDAAAALTAAPGAPVPVGDATAAALTRVGGTTVFGVGGTHTVPLLGAFERSGTIDFVAARTELGAAYMAIGYARATGRPGVVLTSTGPGALNAAAALADAAWSSVPLLHLTTEVASTGFAGAGFAGAVHETPAQSEILRLAGGAVVSCVDDAVDAAVDEAWTLATGRPTGPVTLVLPAGRWNEPARAGAGPPPARPLDDRGADVVDDPAPPPGHAAHPSGRRGDDEAALGALVAALTAAERPLVYAGGGAVRHDGGAAVRRLAETIGAPIVTSYQGKGIAGPAHPLWFGPTSSEAAVRDCCARADVAVVFGANLSAAGTDQWRLPLPEQAWRVGYERRPHPHYPQLQEIHTDAAAAADGLAGRLGPRPPWADLAAVRAEVEAGARLRGGPEMEFVDALREAPGTAALVALDMTKAGFWLIKHLPVAAGGHHAFSGYLAMGTALPMAIGMAVATGDGVLAVVGDGALQMSLAELAVVAERQLPVTILVIVDGAYGMLAENAAAAGGSRRLGVELWNPDLPALARAFGFGCDEAEGPADLRRLLDKATVEPRMILLTQKFTRQW